MNDQNILSLFIMVSIIQTNLQISNEYKMPFINNFPKNTNLDVSQQSEGLSNEYSEEASRKFVSEFS